MFEIEGQEIKADFPYTSHYLSVNGSKMHYIEQGVGDPLLFIHGVPTSSYMWRNVIPYVSPHGRCIAVDLIGLGKSDKPDIAYTVFDHIEYLTGFIEALGLKNLTLVMHGWGSVIGFSYAMQYPEQIKALAFVEAHIRPLVEPTNVSLPLQEFLGLSNNNEPSLNHVLDNNNFLKRLLSAGCLRRLEEEEIAQYLAPFPDVESRKPILQFLKEIPAYKKDPEVLDLISHFSHALQKSEVPKLMLYAIPGFNTTIDTVMWAKNHLPNLELADLDEALHLATESNPQLFGEQLAAWYKNLK